MENMDNAQLLGERRHRLSLIKKGIAHALFIGVVLVVLQGFYSLSLVGKITNSVANKSHFMLFYADVSQILRNDFDGSFSRVLLDKNIYCQGCALSCAAYFVEKQFDFDTVCLYADMGFDIYNQISLFLKNLSTVRDISTRDILQSCNMG